MAKMTLRDQMGSFDKLFHIIVRSSKGTLRQSTMTLIHAATVSHGSVMNHRTCGSFSFVMCPDSNCEIERHNRVRALSV